MRSFSAALPFERPEAITRLQGSALVLMSGVIFSFGGLALRSTSDITAWEYLFFRGVGMVSATLAILLVQHHERLAQLIADVRPSHVGAGILLGSINCLFIVSLTITDVAFVLAFQTLSPVTAAYFSWLLMRERVSRNVVIATMISMVGILVMVSGTLTDDVDTAALIAVALPIVFGLYATIIRAAQRIDPSIPIFVAGVVLISAGSAVVLVSGGFDTSAGDAAIGIFAGSLLLAFPLAVFNMAQRVVPSPETSLLLMTEVILAPVWVWLFVDEQPQPTTLLGGSIVLGAIVWLTLRRPPRPGRTLTTRG